MSKEYQKSYSLTEMSIVLTIISIISGAAISIAITQNDIIKLRQTVKKMETIEQAVAGFAAINDRIPCPGDITLSISNSSAGNETCGCQTIGNKSWSTLPTNYASAYSDNLTVSGTVPVRVLQLPNDFMLDGWGNKIIYTYSKPLSGNSGGGCGLATQYQLEQTNMGLINIINASGSLTTNQAAYALFSAGPNGLGAFEASGSGRNPAPTGANELINYNAISTTNGASTGTFLQMTQNVDPAFDDIVRYKMKWQLVKEAGAVISNSVCTAAAQIMVETPDYVVNSVNYPPFCQNAPGNPFCAIYLYNMANYVYKICLNKY